MTEHIVNYDKYIKYFTALAQLERYEVLYELIETTEIDKDNEEVVIKDQIWFDLYGHLDRVHELYIAIMNSPYERVLDGSESIILTNKMVSFGRFDDKISPIVEDILNKVHKEIPMHTWTLDFAFGEENDTMFCSIRGHKTINENTVVLGGTTFGQTIEDCLRHASGIIEKIVGG